MTEAAAFRATFSDLRTVKGRKVVQLLFEVPLEDADAALKALGGIPRPDESRWVGIARLNITESGRDEPPLHSSADSLPSAGSPAPAPTDHTWSRRAALLCQDRQFYDWLGVRGRPEAWQEDAARHLRDRLQISSRAELDVSHPARERFKTLLAEFEKDTGRMPEPR